MRLNIINQSSSIELTSYQIAFIEEVLHLSRIREELREFYYFGERRLNHIFKKDFSLNIPIYLVNKIHFKRIREEYDEKNGIEKESEPNYPDEKQYIPEEELHRRNLIPYSEMADENIEKLRSEKEMRREFKNDMENLFGINKEDKYKGKMKRTDIIETLGVYFPNYNSINKDTIKQPAIFLCMETISEKANDYNEFLYLTLLVLFHEISHHIINNDKDYLPQDEFSQWMEESLANCIALNMLYNVLDVYTDEYPNHFYHKYGAEYLNYLGKHTINQLVELLDFSKEYVISQPKNYQLGYYLFMYGQTRYYDYSWRWKNDKHKLSNFRHKEKQEWLEYVKYDMIKDSGVKLERLYDNIFDGL